MGDVVQESRKFTHFAGENRSGHWVREAICCDPLTRTFERHTRGKDEDGKPCIVKAQIEEIVYNHHGFHPFLDGEKKPRKAFFFRGARVWRD